MISSKGINVWLVNIKNEIENLTCVNCDELDIVVEVPKTDDWVNFQQLNLPFQRWHPNIFGRTILKKRFIEAEALYDLILKQICIYVFANLLPGFRISVERYGVSEAAE